MAEGTDHRYVLTKLAALLAELETQFDAHLYWQRLLNDPTAPGLSTIYVPETDNSEDKLGRLDLSVLSPDTYQALVTAQLSGSFVNYSRSWDEVSKLANHVLQALTAPAQPPAPVPPS
jgi:hypothetical protein